MEYEELGTVEDLDNITKRQDYDIRDDSCIEDDEEDEFSIEE